MGFTPPEQRARPANFPQSSASLMRLGGAIASLALAVFALGIFDDAFVDEYAYITQSYYSDLFFSGKVNDPAWLYDFAFDLQPLPKYFIGKAMRAAQLENAGAPRRGQMVQGLHTRFGPPQTLTVARIPFIGVGAHWVAWPCSRSACWSAAASPGRSPPCSC